MAGNPQLKGIVLKTLIKKPKKPNSANRKCVRVRLSTGREVRKDFLLLVRDSKQIFFVFVTAFI